MQVQGLHKMAAMLSGMPALELSAPEADTLGGALYDVAQEYGIVLSGPRAVWIKLIAAVGMVYGPKVLTIAQQQREARPKRATRPATPADADFVPQGGQFDYSAVPS